MRPFGGSTDYPRETGTRRPSGWRLLLPLVVAALCVPPVPVAAAAGASGATPPAAEAPASYTAAGTSVSGGAGGFVPVAAQRVFDSSTLSGRTLASGVTRTFRVTGATRSIPATGVSAVVISVVASSASTATEITVWPAGAARPAAATLGATRGTTNRVMAIVRLPTDGRLSVRATRGKVKTSIDVLGWFSSTGEIGAIAPQRVVSRTLGAGQATWVKVAGQRKVPANAAAVILALTSTSATRNSKVTAWTTGASRPASSSLVADPGRRRENIAIVKPNAAGRVSLFNQTGRTRLAVDVIGWLPAASSYRPMTPAVAFDSAPSGPIAAGRTVEIPIAGVGSVPPISTTAEAESAHSVVVTILASSAKVGRRAPKATTLVAWPTGSARPATTSLATTASTRLVSSTTVVPLGNDGHISLRNGSGAASIKVVVNGWFANPVLAASLVVPEDTVIPKTTDVASVTVATGGDATVVLAAGAARVQAGDTLVIPPAHVGTAGVLFTLEDGSATEDPAEDGMLANVVGVTTAPDGSQVVATEPALLEEAFTEGDVTVDLGNAAPVVEELTGTQADGGRLHPAADAPTKGVKVDWEFGGGQGKDDEGHACSLAGVAAAFGPLFDMEFKVKWNGLHAPTVTALATLGVEARLALHDVMVECGWSTRILKAKVTFAAGPVPVRVVFEVGVALDVTAGLNGMDLGMGAGASITIGVRNNKGVAEANAGIDLPTFSEKELSVANLGAYAMADVWLSFGVKLYGVIGPKIAVGPFIEAKVTTAAGVPWWSLDMGFAARINLDLDLWFKEWSWSLWNGEIPLADLLKTIGLLDDCLPLPHAALAGEPCRETTVPTQRPDGSKRTFEHRIRLMSAGKAFVPLKITPPGLRSGRVGMAYTVDYDVSGAFSDPVAWKLASPIPGMTLNATTGVLSGTPTTAGTYEVTVEVRYGLDLPTAPARDVVSGFVVIKPESASAVSMGDISAGWLHTCAIAELEGFVYCWGYSESGQAGYSDPPYFFTPKGIDIVGQAAVSAGGQHSCALGTDGVVRCLGDNQFGQLGVGTFEDTTAPDPVIGLGTAIAVAAGEWHTCALLADHTVSCWGQNDVNGQAGDPGGTHLTLPHPVAGVSGVKAIAAGGWHTCALTTVGDVYCWGANYAGQLGHVGPSTATPTKVDAISGATAIAAGWSHTCAVLADGSVRCWGDNTHGQLGVATPAGSATPLAVAGIADVLAIAAGGEGHTCAITADNELFCWGLNADGQLGSATAADSATPVHVALTDVTAVDAGVSYTCALALDTAGTGTEGYACWGSNIYGELGRPGPGTSTPVFMLNRY